MKVYDSAHVRNFVVAGHGGSGKTTLVAAALHTAGATPKLGRVEEGSTVTDFDEQEIQRRLSIASAPAVVEWDKSFKISLIDTPGFNLFLHEAEMAMAAVECVLLVVDAASGVQVQTAKIWKSAERHHLPVIIVIHRADHDHADLAGTLQSLQQTFGRGICPVQVPLGEGGGFRGVVDLVTMKARGGEKAEADIPTEVAEAARTGHESLVELIAEGDDALMEEFFERGTIDLEHLERGLKEGLRARSIFPVLYSSAFKPAGSVDTLLDFITRFAPAPGELGEVAGMTSLRNGKPLLRAVRDDAPLSLFVWKTLSDPFAGRLSYFKVCSGRVRNDDTVTNFNRSSQEKLSHLSVMQGKQAIPIAELHAGDIGAVAKLHDTLTGDTLGDRNAPIFYPPAAVPEASIHFAIEARSRSDEDKMGAALHKMLEEDPALHFDRDEQTREFLLGGTGQQHVEIAVARLKQRYNVDVKLKAPKVPYRETIQGKADVQGRHKKQTGGHGQYGDCKIRVEPLPRGSGFEFVNEIFGGAIPKNFIPAVEKGIVESAQRGYLAGFPVVDFRVVLYDGSYHEVDSSEMAFKIAGSLAFKAAMEKARPTLLEPVMNVDIETPQEYTGDLLGDLNSRRGRIAGMDERGGMAILHAQVPMAEMLTYQSDLTALTQGRGGFRMEMSHYDLVPTAMADRIIAHLRAERGELTQEAV